MKSFLDRFRRKGSDDAAPPVSSDPSKSSETTASGGGAPASAQPSAAALGSTAPSPETAPRDDHEVRLELGDFLHRIPQNLLRPGPHDVSAELRFDIGDLSSRIAKGQTTIDLAEIHQRIPQIFRSEVRPEDHIEIRFPWQKLMNLVKATDAGAAGKGGITLAAAESLSQKLRNRRPARNIIPGAPTAPPTAPEPTSPASPAAEKPAPGARPGSRTRQPNWFSKPGGESNPLTGPASAPLSVVPPSKPTPPAEHPPIPTPSTTFTQESLKLVEVPAASAAEPALISATTPEETSELTRDELIRGLNAANLKLAQTKGDFERQLTAIANERTVFNQERDKVLAELDRARKELADKIDHIEFQTSLSAKTAENVTKVTADKDAAQIEIARLREDLEAAKKAGDERLAALTRERDALIEQKAHIAEQLATAAKSTSAKPAPASEGERSKKEYQRQLDELQRRIIGFESSQREAAQELSREREIRIKAERALTSADRARQEASALIETMRNESRRDADVNGRKRDAEFARTQKELQEKLDSLTEAQRKTAAERDALAAEIAKLKTESLETAEKNPDPGWEARAVASLEEDIAKYRVRIKSLLTERDSIATEKEVLASALSKQKEAAQAALSAETQSAIERDAALKALEQSQSALAKAASEQEALQTQSAAISGEKGAAIGRLEAITKTHEEQADELKKSHAAVASSEKLVSALRAQLEKLAEASRNPAEIPMVGELRGKLAAVTKERDEAQADWEKLVAELDAFKTKREQELAKRDQESLGELGKLKRQIAEQEKTATSLAAARDEADRKLTKANDALAAAKSEHETVRSSHSQTTAGISQAHEALKGDLAALHAQNDKREKAFTELQSKFSAAEAAIGQTEAERKNATAKAAEELAAANLAQNKALAELTAQRTEFQARLAASESAFSHAKTEQKTATAKASDELAAAKLAHDKALAELNTQRTDLQSKLATAESALAHAKTELKTATAKASDELAAAKLAHDKALAEFNTQRTDLQSKLATSESALVLAKTEQKTATAKASDELAAAKLAHDKALAELNAHGTDLQSKLATSESALLRANSEHESYTAGAIERYNAIQSAHDVLAATLARTQIEHASNVSLLQKELETANAAAKAELADANANHEATRQKLAEERATFAEIKTELEESISDGARALEQVAFRAQELDTTVQAREAALREKHAANARLKTDNEAEIAKLVKDHEQALVTLTVEKDHQLATLYAEKARGEASLTRERDEFESRLSSETARLAAKLEETETTLSTRIAKLTGDRDDARNESAVLAQRLGALSVESDRKLEELRRNLEDTVGEHRAIEAELEGAKEAHKAQSAVFAREFKTVVKQRDDAMSDAAAARADIREVTNRAALQRAEVERTEGELVARFDREAARLRRERDLFAQQRDELRDRISRMVDEQRQMLDEFAAQSTRQVSLPSDVLQTTREPREDNVIDISEAEIVESVDSERGINLPRIRPVPIRPPNVRVL